MSVVAPSGALGEPDGGEGGGPAAVGAPFGAPEIAAMGLLIGGLVLSVTLFVALRLYATRPGEPVEGPAGDAARRVGLIRTSGAAPFLLVAFVLIYAAHALGAGSARALVRPPAGETAGLGVMALLQLGAYVGGFLGIAAAVLVAPGVGRVLLNGLKGSRLVRDGLRSLGWLALILPLVLTTTMLSNAVVIAVTGETPEAIGHTTLRSLAAEVDRGWAFALIIVCVTIGAPIVEEVLYRGCLQSALRRFLGGWWSIVGASLLFAAVHVGSVEMRMLPGLFVLSLGMGVVYERTGRLLPCVLVHGLFNGLNVAAIGLL